jgi:ClpP class serine protease
MKKTYKRIFAQLFGQCWLITEDWMLSIIEIANREGDIEAVESRLSSKLEGTETVSYRGNVAIIPVSGPIFPKANLFTRVSGATSIETLATDLTAAIENDEISSIILNVDSPGGHVTGIHEMANMIRTYGQIKPIHGYSGGTAASGGYWLLSACNSVTIDATARLGSIGVVVAMKPKSPDDPVEIVSTASPLKRVDYTTDEGKAVIVEELDALAEVFVSSVAKFRGVTDKDVLKNFGKGGILVGENAVAVGMADKTGSLEELIALYNEGGHYMKDKMVVTADNIKTENQEVYTEIFEAGAKSAESKQLEQIASLQEQVDSLKVENATLQSKVEEMDKKEAIRVEQNIKAVASAIVSDRLSTSSVPSRLHTKVKALIDHNKFVVEGQLDSEGFKAHVDTEVSEWEVVEENPIEGVGSNSSLDEGDKDSKEVDDIVSRLASLA